MQITSPRRTSRRALLLALALMASPAALLAANTMATPDPALVARYMGDTAARHAKLAECKKKYDPVGFMSDVACMSAENANRKAASNNLASTCNAIDTFVYVPGKLTGKAREDYFIANTPSDAILKNCNLTKEKWLSDSMKRAPR
ncbi:hypothetical protein F2P45_24755 [Massilia sp. CCM 8733]|uniref:Secreted protein n=1 Tax=Massilia mucilaginosa TaxID=2609282 RepID=A0ABX0P029_9BURK|nr:hypothetical protein [Massilia mucilaginosa]NHZ92190.1 hypothetical protein [Massilia mucilaginosa]